MTENHQAHYTVQIVAVPHLSALDPNGTYSGVTFQDGFAYVSWKDFPSEHKSYVAIQALGQDERFAVKEIPESQYHGYGSKEFSVRTKNSRGKNDKK